VAYTWDQFNDEVRLHLPIDKDRANVQDLLDREIRHAVIDIQGFIARYRQGHETIYCPTDFVTHNKASLGRLPEGARIKEGYIIRTKAGDVVEKLGPDLGANKTYVGTTKVISVTQNFKYRFTKGANETSLTNGVTVLTASGDFIASGSTVTLTSPYTDQAVTAKLERVMSGSECVCGTHPVMLHAWEDRLELVDGQCDLADNNGLIAIDPEGSGAFYLYPAILSKETVKEEDYSYAFRLHWSGRRVDFAGAEKVPFDEPMTRVVALSVRSSFEKLIRRDLAMSDSYRQEYVRERLNLYLNR